MGSPWTPNSTPPEDERAHPLALLAQQVDAFAEVGHDEPTKAGSVSDVELDGPDEGVQAASDEAPTRASKKAGALQVAIPGPDGCRGGAIVA